MRIEAWSLGIILCKMLTGRVAFYGETDSEIFNKIVRQEVDFMDDMKADITIEAQDIVENLLNKYPNHRLTISQVLSHSWIKNVSLRDKMSELSYT